MVSHRRRLAGSRYPPETPDDAAAAAHVMTDACLCLSGLVSSAGGAIVIGPARSAAKYREPRTQRTQVPERRLSQLSRGESPFFSKNNRHSCAKSRLR